MTLTESFTVQRDPSIPGPWQVLAGGERTAGSVMFGEARLPAHTSGPGLHVHTREDEAVFVISGVMTFVVGEERFKAGAGELVWLPREVPHTFANLGDQAAWAFGVTTPAGLEGMFSEQAEYFATLNGPPDPNESAQSATGMASALSDRVSLRIDDSGARTPRQAAANRTRLPRSGRGPQAC